MLTYPCTRIGILRLMVFFALQIHDNFYRFQRTERKRDRELHTVGYLKSCILLHNTTLPSLLLIPDTLFTHRAPADSRPVRGGQETCSADEVSARPLSIVLFLQVNVTLSRSPSPSLVKQAPIKRTYCRSLVEYNN